MVKIAGGMDKLARAGGESVRVSWEELVKWAPEVLIVTPCGFNLQQTMKHVWQHFGPYQCVDVPLLRGLLEEGKDYYREGDALVFTAGYLARRGYCCDSGCRHCPY